MRSIQKREPESLSVWWLECSPLEKVGTVAVGGAVALVAAVVLFPNAAAAVSGGALASGGAFLLKKGFGK